MKKCVLNVLAVLAFVQIGSAQNIVYVDQTATGNADGTSWVDAFPNINDALDNAQDGDTFWVAQGVYTTTGGAAAPGRENSIAITRDSVSVYGGFDGTETSLNQRDFRNNETIFTGDYMDTPQDNTDDAYTVLRVYPVSDTLKYVRIDGLTIKNGYADAVNQGHRRYGGGVYIEDGVEYMDIRNCIITENYAHGEAGIAAVLNYGIDVEVNVENCHITKNKARFRAAFGFVAKQDRALKVNLLNCLIDSNECGTVNGENGTVASGGGMIAEENGDLLANIVNCTFTNNIYNGSSPSAIQGLIMIGETTAGSTDVGTSEVNLINSIVWNNDVSTTFTQYTFPFANDVLSIRNSNTEDVIVPLGGIVISNDYHVDPMFTNTADDFTLQSTSPLINVGTQVGLGVTLPGVDLSGNTRVSGSEIDLGCYEYDPSADVVQLESSAIQVYPNPAQTYLRIDSQDVIVSMEIIDVYGKVRQTVNKSTEIIDVSGLVSGAYILRVYLDSGVTFQRFVKN